jgi:hypothetical protein
MSKFFLKGKVSTPLDQMFFINLQNLGLTSPKTKAHSSNIRHEMIISQASETFRGTAIDPKQ